MKWSKGNEGKTFLLLAKLKESSHREIQTRRIRSQLTSPHMKHKTVQPSNQLLQAKKNCPKPITQVSDLILVSELLTPRSQFDLRRLMECDMHELQVELTSAVIKFIFFLNSLSLKKQFWNSTKSLATVLCFSLCLLASGGLTFN